LTAKAEQMLARLSAAHLDEIHRLEPAIATPLERFGEGRAGALAQALARSAWPFSRANSAAVMFFSGWRSEVSAPAASRTSTAGTKPTMAASMSAV
jgi:hypothetical protein